MQQTDVHSPQTTVREALVFSASLRINGDVDKDTIEAYVDEVMDLVELSSLRGVVVRSTTSWHNITCRYFQDSTAKVMTYES